jgi:photosystem II stability/assembly factor-like uncharacterized protein
VRRGLCAALLVAVAALLAACGLEPKPRTLPAGFATPRFLLISDEAQGALVIGGDYGMQYSLNGGRTWLVPAGGRTPAIAAAPYADRILVSRGPTAQVYDYTLEGEANPRVAWPFGGAATHLAGNARRERLWAITQDADTQLHYSNDSGAHWWPMPSLGLCPRPRGIAVGGAKGKANERLWVACGRRGLLVSTDLGVSFQAVPGISNARSVAAARTAPGRIAVTTPQVLVTRDYGQSWTLSGLNATAVAIDPRNPDLVFAVSSDGRLFASLDGGASF